MFSDQLASRCSIADMSTRSLTKIKHEEADQIVPSWHYLLVLSCIFISWTYTKFPKFQIPVAAHHACASGQWPRWWWQGKFHFGKADSKDGRGAKANIEDRFQNQDVFRISEWPKSKQSNCWPRCARTTTWAVGCGMSLDPMMAKRLLSVWLGASPVWFKWQLLGKWHLRCKWHIGNVAFIFYFILVLVECPYLRPCPTLSTWHVSKSCWKASPFSSQFPWHRRSFTYPHGASISLRKRNMERKGDGRRTCSSRRISIPSFRMDMKREGSRSMFASQGKVRP